MSIDDQNLSEELEKMESISGRKPDSNSCDHNPFQRRNKCNGRTVSSSWPGKCYCPYIKKPTRNTTINKKHNGRVLKQPTFKYAGYCYQNEFKLEELSESLPVDTCLSDSASEKSKQCSPYPQQASCTESDVSIYELASYFEILVDIPKQMSLMAEMMYM